MCDGNITKKTRVSAAIISFTKGCFKFVDPEFTHLLRCVIAISLKVSAAIKSNITTVI